MLRLKELFAGAEVERYKAEMMKDPKFAAHIENLR